MSHPFSWILDLISHLAFQKKKKKRRKPRQSNAGGGELEAYQTRITDI